MPPLSVFLPFAILFVGTFVLMLGVVPILSRLAKKWGLVDKPDERRKLHARVVPLIGGVSVFVSVLVMCLLVLYLASQGTLDSTITEPLTAVEYWQLGGLLVAGLLIVGVGVLDDRFGIRGRQKLAAQLVVAGVLVYTGTWVQSVSLSDGTLRFGDAFTSIPAEDYAKLDFELQHFHRTEADRLLADQRAGKIDSATTADQIERLDTTVQKIRSNAYIRLFVFNRLLALAAMMLTVLWIVGAINSVNLIDGADGLAGTTTLIISLALAVIAFWTRHYVEAAISLSLAGALLGFLVFNFPPAKIFLGDAGSMLIGMVLAALAVQSYLKQPMLYICMAPLAMLFIPIFDSATAFTRRLATGRSIYSTDRGHLHHILLRHGLSNRGMIFFVGGLTTITAVGAVMTVILQNSIYSLIGVGTVIVFLVSAKVFGFAEFKLLCSRLYRLFRSLVMPAHNRSQPQSMSVQLQGSKQWDKLWNSITDFGDKHNFTRIKLDLNLPWLHESFHADWKKSVQAENDEVWQTRLPLAAKGRIYGRIEIAGVVGRESIYLMLMLLADLLENLEPALAALAEGVDDSVTVPVLSQRRRPEPVGEEVDESEESRDRVAS